MAIVKARSGKRTQHRPHSLVPLAGAPWHTPWNTAREVLHVLPPPRAQPHTPRIGTTRWVIGLGGTMVDDDGTTSDTAAGVSLSCLIVPRASDASATTSPPGNDVDAVGVRRTAGGGDEVGGARRGPPDDGTTAMTRGWVMAAMGLLKPWLTHPSARHPSLHQAHPSSPLRTSHTMISPPVRSSASVHDLMLVMAFLNRIRLMTAPA